MVIPNGYDDSWGGAAGYGGTAPASGLHAYRERYSYEQLSRYYMGEQPLSYLHPEIADATRGRLRTLVVNWPRLIIDSLEERLDVEGFRLDAGQGADAALWRIWQANDLDEWSQQCHVEALLHGRAYALVWADDQDASTPRISIESSAQMAVRYDPGTTNITQAVKRWYEDDLAYATLYLPDRIEKYVAPTTALSSTHDLALTASAWELREEPVSHDIGQVPVVPFVNRPRLTRPFGETELADVIPLADAVNKLATDMMVSAEYHAMPRRWATGVDLGAEATTARTAELVRKRWTEAAAGRVWLSDSKDARMGQFTEASLDNFVNAIELLTGQVAALSGLPPHYVGLHSKANPASADAIRSAESSLVKRAQRKQRVFGGSWERVMRLALLVRDGQATAGSESMETIWRDPQTPTVAEKTDAAVKLIQVGLPFEQALEDLGYTPAQQTRIAEQRQRDALGPVDAQLTAAERLQTDQGLSQPAALAAVGLLQAANLQHQANGMPPAM